jgi:hypothetical protein
VLQKVGGRGVKEIDQENLDTAISLGDAVCSELGICCEKRGRVIFQIYKKLEDLRPRQEPSEKTETIEATETSLSGDTQY